MGAVGNLVSSSQCFGTELWREMLDDEMMRETKKSDCIFPENLKYFMCNIYFMYLFML